MRFLSFAELPLARAATHYSLAALISPVAPDLI
jgi:hypothetical protein